MAGYLVTSGRSSPRPAPIARIETALAVALSTLVVLVAALVVTRRAAGALRDPLPATALLTVGAVAAIWMADARRRLVRAASRVHPPAARWAASLLPMGVAVAICLAIWLPGTSSAGAVLLWAPLAIAVAWTWRGPPLGGKLGRAPWRRTFTRPRRPDRDPTAHSELPAADVAQQLVRRREPDGHETIHGWVRADLAAGQQTAWAHVAFCPPLSAAPQCEFEQADGPPARVKIGQMQPYGMRFDLRLDRPATQPTAVLVEFHAREAAG